MSPPRSLRRSVVDGVGCWLLFLACVAVTRVMEGEPLFGDVFGHGLIGLLSLVALALSSFLTFGAPVTLHRRWGLVGPALVTALYVGFFLWVAFPRLPESARHMPYVFLLYSVVPAVVVAFVALVENSLRRFNRDESADRAATSEHSEHDETADLTEPST